MKKRLLCLLALPALLSACRSDGPTPPVARDRNGHPLRWWTEEIVLEAVAPPARVGLSSRDLQQALELASAAWRLPGVPHFVIRESSLPEPSQENAINTVAFRAQTWCPSDASRPCYPPTQLALTVPYVRARGSLAEVIEADIELNAVDFHFDDGDAGRDRLRLALIHELGHVLGLDHVCGLSHAGATLPRCDKLSSASIMRPGLLVADSEGAVQPSPADLAALRSLYGS